MNFQLQPIRTECLACHLGGEHGFFGIPDTRRVRQKLDTGMLYVYQHIVFLVVQFNAFHGYRHHFRSGSHDGTGHQVVGIKLTCT